MKTKHKSSRFEMAEALRKRNHVVTLVVKREVGTRISNDKQIVKIPAISGPIFSKLIFGMTLYFYLPFHLKNKKIDVILIDGVDVWFPFILLLKLLHIPLILDIRSTTIKGSLDSLFLGTSILLGKYFANGFTTITPELKDILIKRYKVKKEKIGVWTSGVSLKKFTNSKNSDTLQMRDNISKPFTIMYHGSYSPYRGIENIISSIKNLNNEIRKDINLLFIGFHTKNIDELKRFSKRIGVSEQVEFIPEISYEKIPDYISMCDVGIIPLPPENEWCWESSPLKTLEYLAMEKPIIATAIPFHQRLFKKGNCGILIKNSDPLSIANAIIEIYTHRGKLNMMGKTGRGIVEKYFTWNKKALDLENFITTVL